MSYHNCQGNLTVQTSMISLIIKFFKIVKGDARMIIMDAKTQFKVDIISKVYDGRVSIKDASKLGKSRRTIERYLKSYKERVLNLLFIKIKIEFHQIKYLFH